MSVCMNCSTHGVEDMDVISHLIKIRLKPKVLLNHYMLCVRCGPGRSERGGGWRGGWPRSVPVPLGSPCVQGAAERAQGQSGHHHQVCGLQRALQRPEPQQHAGPVHGAAAQLGAGAQGRARRCPAAFCVCAAERPRSGRRGLQAGEEGVVAPARPGVRTRRAAWCRGAGCVEKALGGGRGPGEQHTVASDFRSGPQGVRPCPGRLPQRLQLGSFRSRQH